MLDIFSYLLDKLKIQENYLQLYNDCVGKTLSIPHHILFFGVYSIFKKNNNLKNYSYVFDTASNKHIINSLESDDVLVIVYTFKDIIFCFRNNIAFVSGRNFLECVKGIMNNSDFTRIEKALDQEINETFSMISFKLLFVNNTSWPKERALINLCTMRNKRSICIQHGVFFRVQEPHELDGFDSDYFLSYDEYQTEIMIMNGRSPSSVFPIGFIPSKSKFEIRSPEPDKEKRVVAWLGQPFLLYSDEYHVEYIRLFNDFRKKCLLDGYNLVYFPHPREIGLGYLSDIKNVSLNNYKRDIDKYEIFASINSTSLVDCSILGKTTIQVYTDNIPSDDMSKMGVSEIYLLTKNIKDYKNANTMGSFSKSKFLEALNEIES